jgi:hypothetical protein
MKISMDSLCHLWNDPSISMSEFHRSLEPGKLYVDYSHLERRIVRCSRCGQLFFYEDYEIESWDDGNDSMYSTWIPVDDIETADELSRLPPMALMQFPSLRYDYPTGADKTDGPHRHAGFSLQVQTP